MDGDWRADVSSCAFLFGAAVVMVLLCATGLLDYIDSKYSLQSALQQMFTNLVWK